MLDSPNSSPSVQSTSPVQSRVQVLHLPPLDPGWRVQKFECVTWHRALPKFDRKHFPQSVVALQVRNNYSRVVLNAEFEFSSGGSRGGSQGAMDPPFQAEHCMQKQDSQQLTEVQHSLPATVALLSYLYSLATNNH